MKLLSIKKDTDGVHKYVAVFLLDNEKTKTIRFGAYGYEDYTTHKDEERKKLYINRHRARENWNDPTTAGALSYHLLWSEKTFKTALSKFKKKFNL
jgi:acetone carboxylase gamma subunit